MPDDLTQRVYDVQLRLYRVEQKLDIFITNVNKIITRLDTDAPKITEQSRKLGAIADSLNETIKDAMDEIPFPPPVKGEVSDPRKAKEVVMVEVDNLEKAVTRISGAAASAEALIHATAQYIRDNVTDPAKLQSYADALDARSKPLADAVEANPVPVPAVPA